MTTEQYISREKAANLLGVSEKTLRRYTKQGKIQSYDVSTPSGVRIQYLYTDVAKLGNITETEVDNSKHIQSDLDNFNLSYQLIRSSLNQSPLANFKALEEAVSYGWILPTKTVAELIGLSPRGKVYRWGSFEFIKCGKVSYSSGWLVTKDFKPVPKEFEPLEPYVASL